MNKKIGIIGSGNMGQAILMGILSSKLYPPGNIVISDVSEDKLKPLKDEYGVNTITDSVELVRKSDIVIVAVKPDIFGLVLKQIANFAGGKIIVSIAAGISLGDMEEILGDNAKIVRCMPNTPALVNEGMTAICRNKNLSGTELNEVVGIFNSLGKSRVVPEHLIDPVMGISGSSPAYVFMFIEAMADAAVQYGMPRSDAYVFSAQAVLGAAKMVLESGKHPGELKDMVCSPGGTTIKAVAALEKAGFRNAVIGGVCVCIDGASEINKGRE